MKTAIIDDKEVFFDEKKETWYYKISKQPLEAKVLQRLKKHLERMEAEKNAKFILAVCLDNFGVPAKARFFRPIAGPENKKVWPSHERENKQPLFVLAKGEQYEVHPRIMNNPKAKNMFKAVK
jgi:hypothetical protein